MMKRGAVAAVILSLAALTACSAEAAPAPSAEPEGAARTSSAAPAPTATPTPTPTDAVTNGVPFGSTQEATFGQSKWQITVQEPRDVTEQMRAAYEESNFGWELGEGNVYVGVPGTVKRVAGGLASPDAEIQMGVMVDGKVVKDRVTTPGSDTIGQIPELADGASSEFLNVYEVPAGTPVTSVLALIGLGELSTGIVFGERVEGA